MHPKDDVLYRIRGLSKVFGTGSSAVHALRGVDLDIPEGEFIVLLGPSGSGKTTLLNIVGGLDTPTTGSVQFHGRNLAEFSERELTRYRREEVGFIFQFYNLMPGLTARENVELVTEISTDPMEPLEALAMVGLAARADHFPSQLSGGEQQRVAIARAIAKQPRVMFCDEPTGALDLETGIGVLEALSQVNRELGTTMLVITHNAGVAAIADRVIRFADGQVREEEVNRDKRLPEEVVW